MKILLLLERGYTGTRKQKIKYYTRGILVLRASRSVGLEVRKYVIIRGGDDMALTRNPVLYFYGHFCSPATVPKFGALLDPEFMNSI